jgi:parallel beta-helix repeat protein
MRSIIVSFIIISCLAVNCPAGQRKRVVPNDYPTIQQAIDAAKPKDTVEIKEGTYTESVTFKEGIILKGTVRDKTILCCDANTGSVITVTDCNEGTITELTLLQTGAEELPEGKESPLPVLRLSSSSIKVIRCTIQNGGGSGITIGGKGNCEVSDCNINNNSGSGIYVLGEGAEPTLNKNRCSENKGNGIYFREGAGGTAEDNLCNKNSFNGISVMNKWTSPNLKNNQCSGNRASGIYFGEGARGGAENNICKENEWHGITVADDSSAPELNGNQCLSNRRCGIYYSDGTHITAKDNVLKDNGEINYRQLRNTLWEKKFDELEETASRLRREKSEFTNSNCQLNHFYYSLSSGWSDYKPSYEEELLGILEQWIKEKPESITPRIVMAKAYVDFAWHARGGQWARDVPDYAWKIFDEKLKKAWAVLTEAEKLEEKDPELYRLFIQAGMGLGKSDKEMNLLFEKGIAIGKWYYPLYYQRAIDLLPRWGGDPGELEAFVRRSAELNGGQEGEMLYAKLAGEIATMHHNLGPDSFIELGLSYPRAKQGHIYILEKYPEATYYLNTYCLLASIYEDKKTAKELFEKIGDNWNRNVWKKEEHFRTYQTWAYGPKTHRPRPVKETKSSFEKFIEYLMYFL